LTLILERNLAEICGFLAIQDRNPMAPIVYIRQIFS
jgi:hypothetical protein